jgi:hydrogenase maturation protease
MRTDSPHPLRLLIIGIGNAYRGDDAVGLAAARKLKEEGLPGLVVIEESGDGAALMELWKDAEAVIVVDAIQSGAEPGTVHRFDAHARPIPTELFRCSTHAFGLAEAIELARALDQLPPRLMVYGIEGKHFEAGMGLSSEVERAAEDVVEQVGQELQLS